MLLGHTSEQTSEQINKHTELSVIIDNALSYASTLVGVKYAWWSGQDLSQDGEPFWVGIGEVKRSKIISCSCTGLLNLIRRKCSLNVPGRVNESIVNESIFNENAFDGQSLFPGGIQVWVRYLLSRSIELYGRIEHFDENKHYRRGSLLVRPKMNFKDQGHIAIIYTDDNKTNPLKNKLIHSYPASDEIVSHSVDPGVIIEQIAYSHNLLANGVYKYVFSPETWLTH